MYDKCEAGANLQQFYTITTSLQPVWNGLIWQLM